MYPSCLCPYCISMMHVHDACIIMLVTMGGGWGSPKRDRGGGEEEEGLGQGYCEVWIIGFVRLGFSVQSIFIGVHFAPKVSNNNLITGKVQISDAQWQALAPEGVLGDSIRSANSKTPINIVLKQAVGRVKIRPNFSCSLKRQEDRF